MSNRSRKLNILIVIAISVLAILTASKLHTFATNNQSAVLQNEIVQRMIPMYRSLRKLPDIIFMPWAVFTDSNLETFELTISPQNIAKMNAALPDSPFDSTLTEESKVWVKGYFRTDGYEDSVDVRYRGNLASHWNAYQKSYTIEFPKDNLFRGMRRINLVIPSRRNYYAMSLNDYRARKLDLIAPNESFVRLELNGAKKGVLLSFEHWSQEWIEKMSISPLSTIYGVSEDGLQYSDRWKSWNSDDPIDLDPLLTLQEITDHAPDETFEKLAPLLVNIEDYLKFDVIRILASGYHASPETSFGANNLILIFDRTEGRFTPVPYNTFLYTTSFREQIGKNRAIGMPARFYQRILQIDEYRNQRDELFKQYVAEEKDDDIAFIKNLRDTYDQEFLLDNAKNDTHFSFLAAMNEFADEAAWHFDDPYNILETTYDPAVVLKNSLDIPTSFTTLFNASDVAATAITQHPALTLTTNGITIPPGTHRFDTTIIIPANTKLTIQPGARLLFGAGVSLISYSPVLSEGTVRQPITFSSQAAEPWGVFAIMNTESDQSTITYTTFTNGGEASIHGAYISGTLAFHNSNSIIDNITITNAQGDDGLNVKSSQTTISSSTFSENSSDGVDLDYLLPGSTFKNNYLHKNLGDAIDLSWSTITLEQNHIDICGDKGISAGESSKLRIINNQISNCAIGVAIKDSSQVLTFGNTFATNTVALSAYQKKPFFTGGYATSTQDTFSNNETQFVSDSQSTIFHTK